MKLYLSCRVTYTVRAYNGGFLRLNNYDSSATPTVTSPKYYTGTSSSHTAIVQFDFEPSTHCSVNGQCNYPVINPGPAFTKAVSLYIYIYK